MPDKSLANLTALLFLALSGAGGAQALADTAGLPELQRCRHAECRSNQAKLVALGYEASLAERLAVYQPNLTRLILSPEIEVRPGGFDAVLRSGDSHQEWFKTQVQDRRPITVYRGLTFWPEATYDPAYFYKLSFPITDSRQFTSDNVRTAVGYAVTPGKRGLLLRFQLPRFMLYEKPGGPYGLVYFRDLVPDDRLFMTGVATVTPPSDLSNETEPAFADELAKTVKFESFEKSYRDLAPGPLTSDERIDGKGRFLPTRPWGDSICRISEHPDFKASFTDMRFFGDREAEKLLPAALNPPEKTRDLQGERLRQVRARVDLALALLSKLPEKRALYLLSGALQQHGKASSKALDGQPTECAKEGVSTKLPPPPGAYADAAEADQYFELVTMTVKQCLEARRLWLRQLSGK